MELEWIKRYTLKLDASWQPLEIINTFKAFNMCYSGRAKLVSSYESHGSHKIPAVIVLDNYVRKFPFTLTCNRRNVFWRDNYICQYCGNRFVFKDLTMDHVNPKSKGGLKVVAYYTTKSEAERKANRLNKKAGFKKIKF